MTKKAIIWTSVAFLIVGATVGGILWWQNRPDSSEEDKEEDDYINPDVDLKSDDEKNTGSATPKSDSTPFTMSNKQNFNLAKNFFGKAARVYLNRITVTKTIGGQTTTFIFYDNGRFFVTVNDLKAAVEGNYYNGGKRMVVTGAKGKWSNNKGLIAESGDVYSNMNAVLKA